MPLFARKKNKETIFGRIIRWIFRIDKRKGRIVADVEYADGSEDTIDLDEFEVR